MNLLQTFKKQLSDFWSPFYAIILLGVLSAYYFGITGAVWAVTGEFTLFGGEILQMLGIDVASLSYFQVTGGFRGSIFTRTNGIMVIGMFVGCTVAALLSGTIRFRMPTSRIRIFQALVGGIIAGFGARLGMGCNLASFFTGIPQFSLHAWIFTIFMILGIYIGAKVTNLTIFKNKTKLQKLQKIDKSSTTSSNLDSLYRRKNRRFTLGVVLFFISIGIGIILSYFHVLPFGKSTNTLGIALIFGIFFGLLIAKAQVCFTSAFRDLFLTGRSDTAIALVLGMIIATIGIFGYIALGANPKIMWAGPNAILGGLLFGFGIVFAGGCECGWMYRAIEGQTHFMLVGIGNIIGASLLALSFDYFLPITTSFPRVDLLRSFGSVGGLGINIILLILFLALILFYRERFFKFRRK